MHLRRTRVDNVPDEREGRRMGWPTRSALAVDSLLSGQAGKPQGSRILQRVQPTRLQDGPLTAVGPR